VPLSFIVCPQTQNFYSLFFLADFIHKTVLDVDPTAVRSVQIAHQLFIRRRLSERVDTNDLNECLCLIAQMRSLQLWNVLRGHFRVNDLVHLPFHRRFVHTVRQRCRHSIHNFLTHSRHRYQIQCFHHAAVIVFRYQHRISVFRADADRFIVLYRL